MTKPELFPVGTIEELYIQEGERYLPTAFDDSLTHLQKMNKIIRQLNELGKLTNGMIGKWNELIEWILGEGLEQAVNDKLTEWLNDGTLEDLINKIINNASALDAFKLELAESLTTKAIYFNGNAKGRIKDNVSVGREELQIYATSDAFRENSKGAGIHLYGNGDNEHAGNIAMMTGQPEDGDARLIISGGSSLPSSGGYRTNTDTRVTIGNAIWDFVDTKQDTAMLNLKNPDGRPAICISETSSDEGEIAVPEGERMSLGHWNGTTFNENVAMDGSGRLLVQTAASNGNDAKVVDSLHSPFSQVIGDSQSKSSQLLVNYNADGSSSANLYLGKSSSGAVGTNGTTRTDDTLGEVSFAGNDGTGFKTGASVSASVQTSDWTSTSRPTRLQLKTTPLGSTTPKTVLTANATGSFSAGTDNTQSFGTASYRFSTMFAGTATINTSDRNEKQQIQDITDTILDAWSDVNYCMFKFNDAVEEKGIAARLHFGVIAQKIDEAFTLHGLDAFDYGLLCMDQLEDGTERWGVRMTECLVLEGALMRREINRLKNG